jgi:NAD-dependent dihydropyrimidine dehydrogenase PreA subunit
MNLFKDVGHLFRFVALFIVGTLVILGLRAAFTPRSFGQYGHYRGAALGDIAAHPVHFAGHQACEVCHADVAETKAKGKHAHVNCEACHGAQARHAYDFTNGSATIKPVLPDTAVLCARCHAASAAKPKSFPQVNAADHSGGVPCQTCHQPHSPAIAAGDAK